MAVLGATGFLGSAVVEALDRHGAVTQRVRAPRLSTSARGEALVRGELQRFDLVHEIESLRHLLADCSVVVNAAGLATATAGGNDALVGADALLPAAVAVAAPPHARLVHVSSAAVQGRRAVLDESTEMEPFSPYSAAKAWAEDLVRARAGDTVCFRPTSVHGPGRAVTRTLALALRSPAASVAGRGDRPTPQVLVTNVADAIAHVATTDEKPPPVVLQPWEGLTTAGLVRVLGDREPRHVPEALAQRILALGFRAGTRSGRVAGLTRRLEMMWFGQRQAPGWLDTRWRPPYGHDAWKELA
ncbi:NAD(P)-dependent oxidoreductase [Nocardioides sp. cx-173]|uniref:NAD-dependent epimerase/dehydratase family protein n=1 Tax=Nocardioides sp. cx-173 TaxID=2898796 RepID=UPI001E2E85DC|nr:NAD-dependent epimerase/dehydratase family protein [Nocardioides sp. cx-173]MCD4523762.1 NAD-dependent epimerase/dehydratase family protein [Nocardioides sp. cx-173]UGB41914.1 NAD-dependent epimerase/dehydratase family protein [Nocardioides sp. cx-173]